MSNIEFTALPLYLSLHSCRVQLREHRKYERTHLVAGPHQIILRAVFLSVHCIKGIIHDVVGLWSLSMIVLGAVIKPPEASPSLSPSRPCCYTLTTIYCNTIGQEPPKLGEVLGEGFRGWGQGLGFGV